MLAGHTCGTKALGTCLEMLIKMHFLPLFKLDHVRTKPVTRTCAFSFVAVK